MNFVKRWYAIISHPLHSKLGFVDLQIAVDIISNPHTSSCGRQLSEAETFSEDKNDGLLTVTLAWRYGHARCRGMILLRTDGKHVIISTAVTKGWSRRIHTHSHYAHSNDLNLRPFDLSTAVPVTRNRYNRSDKFKLLTTFRFFQYVKLRHDCDWRTKV